MNWGYLGLFGAGLATFLSPCVLPLAPILVASWATSSSSKWGRFFSTAWFATGFTLTFVALGMTASAFSPLILPFKPLLFLMGSVLLGVFALRMMGMLRSVALFTWLEKSVHLPDFSKRVPKSLGGLVFGLIFGLSWTPCVGPILGAVLTYVAAQQNSALKGALMLLVFSLGISLPLLILALGLDQMRPWLNRLRSWIPRIEYAMGLALFLFAISLFNQARISGDAQVSSHFAPVTAVDQTEAAVSLGSKTNAQSRMVFFYSEHCPICHAMEAYLPNFEHDCASSSFKLSKVDVDLAVNAQAAERFHVSAVPAISIFNDEGAELIHLVGYQSEARLRDAAKSLTGLLCQKNHSKEQFPILQENQTCSTGKSC